MASYMEFPLRFKRQYAEPLDASAYAETLADLDDIKNNPTSYVGMIVSCKEDGNVYKLGLDKEFTLLGVGTGGSVKKYEEVIVGNDSDKTFTVTHGLGTKAVDVAIYDKNTGEKCGFGVKVISDNAIEISSDVVLTITDEFLVTVQG